MRRASILLFASWLLAVATPASAASHTVRNTEDSGDGSLRQAIDSASNGDTILFGSDVRGDIRLSERLDIDHDITLKGPGADVVTVRGADEGSVFDVSGEVIISGLSLSGGDSGINFKRGKLTLIDSAVRNSRGAGVVVKHGGKLTLVRSLIAGNSGVGIENRGGTTTAVNSTIADNSGGGLSNDDGKISLASCTVAGNHGPGVVAGSGEISLQNTLLAENGPACSGTVISKGYNLADDDSCRLSASGDQNAVDAKLGVLYGNGGHTDTMVPGSSSPAIDAGNPSGCVDTAGDQLTIDQRGVRRPSGDHCDIGAVETQVVASSGTVVNRILALVDGDPITLYELKDFAAADVRLRESGAVDQAALLDLLITKHVIQKEVEAQNIVVQDAEIDRYIANIRERNNLTEQQLDEALTQQNLTRETYRAQVKEELQRAQLINREIRGKVSVSPEEIDRYYKEHEDEATGTASKDEQLVLSHIVLQIPPDATDEQIAAVQAHADKLYTELKGGADFATVAARESEDAAAKSGGKLGTFKQGEMREEIAKAVANLDAGEFSQPVRTGNAIHIVRVDERIAAGKEAVADGKRDEVKEQLYAAALEERYNRWLKEDLRQRHHVEVRP